MTLLLYRYHLCVGMIVVILYHGYHDVVVVCVIVGDVIMVLLLSL